MTHEESFQPLESRVVNDFDMWWVRVCVAGLCSAICDVANNCKTDSCSMPSVCLTGNRHVHRCVCVHVWVSVVFLPLQSKRALAHSLALSELSAPTQMFYVLWPQTEAQCCVSQRSWECGGFERERLCVCERENATVRERAQSHTVCECIKYYCKIVCVCEPSEWGENMDLYVCESTKPTKLVLLNLYFVCFLVKICFIPYLLEKQN